MHGLDSPVGVFVGVFFVAPRLFFFPLFFKANLGSARDTDEGFDK